MEVVSGNTLLPGDPRLIDHIVCELKSQGIFDQFRKECIADVDTKPAYQNLRQRVEGSVTGFLKTQSWKPDMNKNHLREMLRKNIYESGFLETGVERIVDQVVNPKINTVFLPQVEDVVYTFLGLEKPVRTVFMKNGPLTINAVDLLPTDLDPISPDSEVLEKSLNKNRDVEKLDDSKGDDFESPPFEPINEQSVFSQQDESSNDSHLSGISGLTSHDSNMSSSMNKTYYNVPDVSNQDSQLSKVSSNSRLSIITTEDKLSSEKMDISDDTQTSKIGDGSNSKSSNSLNFESVSNSENGYVSNFNIKEQMDVINAAERLEEVRIDDRDEVKKEYMDKDTTEVEMDVCDSQDKIEEEIMEVTVEVKVEEKKEEIKEERQELEGKTEPKIEESNKVNSSKSSDKNGSKSDSRSRSESDRRKSKQSENKDRKDDRKSDSDKDKKDKDRRDKEKSRSSTSSKDKYRDKSKDSKSKDKEKDSKSGDKDRESRNKEESTKSDREKSRSSSSSKHSSRDKERGSKSDRKDSSSRDKERGESRNKYSKTEKKDESKTRSDDGKSKSDESKSKLDEEKSRIDDSKRLEELKSKPDDPKSKSDDSKSKLDDLKTKLDDSKSRSDDSRSRKSDSKSDSKSRSKSESSSSKSKDRKSSSSSKDRKDSKETKKSSKRDKDDHFSSKDKKSEARRSADRDSNDGSSGIGTTNTSKESTTSSKSKSSENSFGGSNSGDSGQSDKSENIDSENIQSLDKNILKTPVKYLTDSILSDKTELNIAPPRVEGSENQVKLKKPRFASNIFEARKLMKIRKKLDKMEKKRQKQYDLAQAEKTEGKLEEYATEEELNGEQVTEMISIIEVRLQNDDDEDEDVTEEILTDDELQVMRNNKPLKTYTHVPKKATEKKIDVDFSLEKAAISVISKESWDAIEAKINQSSLMNIDYDSYVDENADNSCSSYKSLDISSGSALKKTSDDEDCLYFNPEVSPKTERYLKRIDALQKLGPNIAHMDDIFDSPSSKNPMAPPDTSKGGRRSRKPNLKYCSNEYASEVTFTTQKVPVIDTGMSRIDLTKKKGTKRRIDGETDVIDSDNNNKKMHASYEDYEDTNEPSPCASYTSSSSVEPTTKPRSTAKSRKRKSESAVAIESFTMPPSPDSDVSANSIEGRGSGRKVSEERDSNTQASHPVARHTRGSSLANQRYSSDDLYKPRPLFTGSRRSRGIVNNADKSSEGSTANKHR